MNSFMNSSNTRPSHSTTFSFRLQTSSFCSAMNSIAIFTFLLFYSSFSTAQISNDTNTLLMFSSQTDTHANLLTNWTTNDACSASWHGVRCTAGRVTGLILTSLNLRGPIDLLSQLDQLRILDLQHNRLNGTILPITNCTNLKLLYLSGNDFSGEIPSEIGFLKRLRRLDFSDNNLQGSLPQQMSKLTGIATIRLQNNILSGQVPEFFATMPELKQLNMSNNQLYGKVPEKLQSKFGVKIFDGNAGLCGFRPLPDCAFLNVPMPNETVVQSSPSSLPATTKAENEKGGSGKGLGAGAVVAIVVANAVVLLVITSFLVAYLCGRYNKESRSNSSSEKKVYASNGAEEDIDQDRSKLVFFDRRKLFELDDLLRASAEMLAKGSYGTVYMAVLENGLTMAVKRLKDSNPCVRKEFEQKMELIGKLRHQNIVHLRAYYYAKEEKLLVYDYLPNGSLYSLLHGSRGPGRIPLDWTTRISLVLGAARGLARIHQEYNALKIPHGNVKSSNVLLDKNGVACISDFGQALLLNPVQATARLGGYQAPEQVLTKRLSHQADVYSFGVLVLEVLTGRAPSQYPFRTHSSGNEDGQGMDLPKWVRSVVREEWTAEVFDPELLRYKNIEEELVAMLHVGLACVAEQAEKRPSMLQVAKMIEDIRVEQSPLGDDSDNARNSIAHSIISTTTEDGIAG